MKTTVIQPGNTDVTLALVDSGASKESMGLGHVTVTICEPMGLGHVSLASNSSDLYSGRIDLSEWIKSKT